MRRLPVLRLLGLVGLLDWRAFGDPRATGSLEIERVVSRGITRVSKPTTDKPQVVCIVLCPSIMLITIYGYPAITDPYLRSLRKALLLIAYSATILVRLILNVTVRCRSKPNKPYFYNNNNS